MSSPLPLQLRKQPAVVIAAGAVQQRFYDQIASDIPYRIYALSGMVGTPGAGGRELHFYVADKEDNVQHVFMGRSGVAAIGGRNNVIWKDTNVPAPGIIAEFDALSPYIDIPRGGHMIVETIGAGVGNTLDITTLGHPMTKELLARSFLGTDPNKVNFELDGGVNINGAPPDFNKQGGQPGPAF